MFLNSIFNKKEFWDNGYVRVGKVLTRDEVDIIIGEINTNEEMQDLRKNTSLKFRGGKYPSFESIFVMNDVTSHSVFSLACRKAKILNFISSAFSDDAYLYHSKVALKYENMPGFKYHQDYFYWYNMGCVFPNMATCFVALDKVTRENGCLKYIPKSHLCGRLEHVMHDGVSDSEAHPERVEKLIDMFGESEIELEPGEAVIHHANLLHASDANSSDKSRLSLLGCYNTKGNNPLPDYDAHPHYEKQARVYKRIKRPQC